MCLWNVAAAAAPGNGMDREIWIAVRTDGQPGTGTATDPFDGSTQAKFDRLLIGLNQAKVTNITIHLGPGTFLTLGAADWRNPDDLQDPCTGWRMDAGWKLVGAGMGNTTIKLAGYSNEFRHRAGISATGGVWKITSAPDWFGWPDIWQGIRLVEGKDLKRLQLGKIYYIAEQLDAQQFRVSATPGGPPLADVAIGADGICYRIVKARRGGEMMSSVITGEGPDLEVRDLTVDINWPAFGGVVAEDFTMPGELQTVIVAVESTEWARPLAKPWVYLVTPLKVHKPIGHFELVRVVDDRHVELRNMQNFKLRSGEPFRDEGTVNVPPGTAVAKGTRMGPEMVTAGVLVEGDRARVERVRVTHQTGTWYEGGCSIGIGSWGGPPYREMVVRDCVVDDMWGGLTAGIHILSRAIFGDRRQPLGQEYGAQGLLEGNTIYANGVFHSGIGGACMNTTFRNNKVVNAAFGFYSEGPLWNVALKDNFFLDCQPCGAIVMGGGDPTVWTRERAFKAKQPVLWKDNEYVAKLDHAGQEPPNEQYWMPVRSWIDNVIIEGNVMELCDRAQGITLVNNTRSVSIRNNVIRYAPGSGSGSVGLALAGAANRRLVVVGNVIDSGLKNYSGGSLVFGRDNVDERGRIRPELERGEHAVQAQEVVPDLEPLAPAAAPQRAKSPARPLVADLGPKGEIRDWLVLGPFPHPPMNTADGTKLGLGYGFDFFAKLGGEANLKPRAGASVAVKFPAGPDAKTFWTAVQLEPRRVVWQHARATNAPVGTAAERATYQEWVDLRPLLGTGEATDNTCVYAACVLRAARETPVALRLGSDDGYVLYVNGQKLGEVRDDRRMYYLDHNVHSVTLRAGDNAVVLKLCNALGGFNFGVRLTSGAVADVAVPGGVPVRGVQVVLP